MGPRRHIEEMIQHIDSGLFQMGGATLAGNAIDGSAIVARARSKEHVMAVLNTDIYARSGVWNLDNIKFVPVCIDTYYFKSSMELISQIVQMRLQARAD